MSWVMPVGKHPAQHISTQTSSLALEANEAGSQRLLALCGRPGQDMTHSPLSLFSVPSPCKLEKHLVGKQCKITEL